MSTVTNYNVNGTDLANIFQLFTPQQISILNSETLSSMSSDNTGNYLIGVAKNSTTLFNSSNGGVNWTTTNINITGTHIINSSSGQYVFMCGFGSVDNQLAISTNYGASWSYQIVYNSTSLTTSIPTSVAISSDGKYMFYCGYPSLLFWSSNYGTLFNRISIGTTQIFTGICCSSSGQYVYVISNLGLKVSSNYGQNFVNNTFSGFFTNICCNSIGNIVMITEYNIGTFISTDYGVTWTKTSLPASIAGYVVTGGTYGLTYTGYISSCLDISGQYLNISFYSGSGTSGQIYLSNNYGNTWNQLNNPAGSYITSFLTTNSNNSILYLTNLTNVYKYTLSSISNVDFNINSNNISRVFQQYSSGNHAPNTNYLTNNVDISQLFQINPNYSLFTVSGTATSQIINGYNLITVTKGTGSINLYVNIPSITIICVAGGGGGNAGSYGATKAGGGGGGGSSCYINTSLNSNTKISLNVGGGGAGGTIANSSGLPGSGGNTTLLVNYTTPSSLVVNQYNITCGGGITTSAGTATINNGGRGGAVVVTTGSNIIASSGANGGNSGSNGQISDTTLINNITGLGYFPIVSNLTSVIQTSYGGGGGGGAQLGYGGTSGNKGIGGIQNGYINQTSRIGQNATTYGDGGGGAGYNSGQSGSNSGGSGGDGIVYIYFPLF